MMRCMRGEYGSGVGQIHERMNGWIDRLVGRMWIVGYLTDWLL